MVYSRVVFMLVIIALSHFFIHCSAIKKANKEVAPAAEQNGVVAHRGAWKNTGTPQNSLASLKAAIAMGCAGSEFDIHMTQDSVLVIFHDPDYFGIPIQKENYSALQGKKLANGESIPLLRDFIKTGILQTETKLVLEIKPSVKGKEWAIATAKKVVQMVHEMQAQSVSMYISFDYEILLEILRIDPKATVQYLKGDKSPETLKADGIAGLDYHYKAYEENEGYILRAKELGLQLNVWTVNAKEQMESFLMKKFDYITTDEPEVLLNVKRSK